MNLKALRDELGFANVEALGEAVGIASSTIYKWMSMKQYVRIDALDKLALGLKIDVHELIMHPDERPKRRARS